MEIDKLLKRTVIEDSQNEFKQRLDSKEYLKRAKVIVGFANNNGGTLYVGVKDNKEIEGLTYKELDKTKNLFILINERHIFPHIDYYFEAIEINENDVFILLIHIKKSDVIVKYKDGDFNEIVFIKEDSSTHKANIEEIITLYNKKHGIDNLLLDIKYKEDDYKEFLYLSSLFRKDHTKISVKELINTNIIDSSLNIRSGLLMFRDDYKDDAALIVCRIWDGKDKVSVLIDKKEFKGPLLSSFNNVIDYINRNTKHGYKKIDDFMRINLDSYKELAIREVLINAIAHRDYTIYGTQIDVDIFIDRINISSVGNWLLPKKYDEYPLGEIPSIRRNNIISSVFDLCNLMERNGSGFLTIMEEYKDVKKSKQPVVKIYEGFIVVTLFDINYDEEENGQNNGQNLENGQNNGQNVQENGQNLENKKLIKTEIKVLDKLKENPYISSKDLHESLNLPQRTLTRTLHSLKVKGYIKRSGTNKKGYWKIEKE